MARTEVLTSIPIPEAHAVSEAPIQFRAAGIAFKVPLFPFEAYKRFNAAIHAFKFRMTNLDFEPDLGRLMELDADPKEGQTLDIGDMLTVAFDNFQEQFKFMPDDLVDIIAGISTPLNIPKTLLKLAKWSGEAGLLHSDPESWQLPETEEAARQDPTSFRRCISTFLKWNMTVPEVVDLLHDLGTANSDIKKKLQDVAQKAECRCPKWHWKRKLCLTQQKYSPDAWVCMSSH